MFVPTGWTCFLHFATSCLVIVVKTLESIFDEIAKMWSDTIIKGQRNSSTGAHNLGRVRPVVSRPRLGAHSRDFGTERRGYGFKPLICVVCPKAALIYKGNCPFSIAILIEHLGEILPSDTADRGRGSNCVNHLCGHAGCNRDQPRERGLVHV